MNYIRARSTKASPREPLFRFFDLLGVVVSREPEPDRIGTGPEPDRTGTGPELEPEPDQNLTGFNISTNIDGSPGRQSSGGQSCT